ncbi:MAG: FAD:protein FMN transferase [Thermoguttaceae bacterium]|nr:FAD:protein FMN transferase [Thermoguttaceae bacterium]
MEEFQETAFAPGPLTVFSRRAMASVFEVVVNDGADERANEFAASAALDALDEVDRVEEALSVFRPTSTVSRANLLAAEMNVRLDDELWSWLESALRLGAETGGAFDVASAPLWRAWGFAKRDGEFPAPDALSHALALSGARHLRLDAEARTLAFDEPGVELNFGAIGKGIALDCASRVLEERGIVDFMVQGGKSGVVARGGRANDVARRREERASNPVAELIDEESGLAKRFVARAPEEDAAALLGLSSSVPSEETSDASGLCGWTIGVAHPLAPERRLGELWLRDRALATSGATYQFFWSGGKRYSHIIDPRTGYPASGVLSATALAGSGAEADALSTAFFVLGVEESMAFCERRPDVGALLIVEREKSPGYEIVTINLDDQTWRPL